MEKELLEKTQEMLKNTIEFNEKTITNLKEIRDKRLEQTIVQQNKLSQEQISAHISEMKALIDNVAWTWEHEKIVYLRELAGIQMIIERLKPISKGELLCHD